MRNHVCVTARKFSFLFLECQTVKVCIIPDHNIQVTNRMTLSSCVFNSLLHSVLFSVYSRVNAGLVHSVLFSLSSCMFITLLHSVLFCLPACLSVSYTVFFFPFSSFFVSVFLSVCQSLTLCSVYSLLVCLSVSYTLFCSLCFPVSFSVS